MVSVLSIPPANPPAPIEPGPLTPEHRAQIERAHRLARKALGPAKVAAFNGWTLAIFAACTLPFAVFSLTALIMGLGLAACAWGEFHGRERVRRFDPRGARRLGFNQLALMTLIVAYSAWCIRIGLSTESQLIQSLGPLAADFQNAYGTSIEQLVRLVTFVVYGSVIALTVIFQGLNALYYFRRVATMRHYLDATPAWIVELQRSRSLP